MELLVVIPVFNEEGSIERVLREWHAMIMSQCPEAVMLVLDDGSSDGTKAAVARVAAEVPVEMLSHPNRGHGQTCLRGYREAIERGAKWIFQIDSDGQCDPQFFPELWAKRKEADIVYGKRTQREDGLQRVVAGWLLRALVLARRRVRCVDPNTPYRLMRAEAIAPMLEKIPGCVDLANVALSALLDGSPGLRHAWVPIRFRERHAGRPKVPLWKFASKAVELWWDLGRIS